MIKAKVPKLNLNKRKKSKSNSNSQVSVNYMTRQPAKTKIGITERVQEKHINEKKKSVRNVHEQHITEKKKPFRYINDRLQAEIN